MSKNSKYEGLECWFCFIMEESGSESGSVPLTNGSICTLHVLRKKIFYQVEQIFLFFTQNANINRQNRSNNQSLVIGWNPFSLRVAGVSGDGGRSGVLLAP